MAQSMRYILVTGTNSGLGLGICTRLIDDFLSIQSSSTSLTLIFTTRSTRKGTETLKVLESHLSASHSIESRKRIQLQPENVELTNLLSIRALSRKLLASKIPYLNAVILNAGIGGWYGLNWFQLAGDFARDIVANTTWPKYKLGYAGLITEKQFPEGPDGKSREETPLGQVFCANLFGHYMLVHWLMQLLSACDASDPGRILWVSSIEVQQRHFKEADLQGLRTSASYESSKRLTDLLALSYDAKSAAQSVAGFTSVNTEDNSTSRPRTSTPTMHIAHPGICVTSIIYDAWILQQSSIIGIYIARWVGSPWATISPYLAAMCFSWLAIATVGEIHGKEKQYGGRVKWGTAVTRSGKPSIMPTEVHGWGISGVGDPYTTTWWAGKYGRAPGSVDATEEDVQEFLAIGGRVWKEMEALREEWEQRIDEFDRTRN